MAKKIGILALQGSVIEHRKSLSRLEGIEIHEVKHAEQIAGMDGMILPGGESTTMGKLLHRFDMMEPLRKRIENGMPVWGTCAGMILLAKQLVDDDTVHLGVMDIAVRRNAYGSQLDSFIASEAVKGVSDTAIPLVFIRAPWVERVGDKVDVLLRYDGKNVAVRERNMLATSFHPELTEDLSFHRYFIETMVNQ